MSRSLPSQQRQLRRARDLLGACAFWTAACLSPAGPLSWEAEELAGSATILDGGDLVVFVAPDPERIRFSGGKAVSFVPRGKGSAVEFVLPVEQEGVYQLRVRGVVGPSCGIYNVVFRDSVRGWMNLSETETLHSDQSRGMRNGYWTKRMLLVEGENRIRFVNLQAPRRGGNLVLDTLQLVPYRSPQRQLTPDPSDAEAPADEKLGRNLLENAGFEDFGDHHRFSEKCRTIKRWQFNSTVPRGHDCIIREPGAARTGKRALFLCPDPLEDNAIVYQARIPASTGKRYRVSLYARGKGFFRADFYQYGGRPSHDDSVRTLNVFEAVDGWRLYSFVMSPSKSGKILSVAIALAALEGSEVTFDDVSVQEILAPPDPGRQ